MTTLLTAPTKQPLAQPERGKLLGLPSSTALVLGSIVGTGVFTMPAVMAGAGTISILTLVAITICAVALGAMFGQLAKRIPNSEGGVYAYARHEFGDFAGYLTASCYWVTAWAGNAAIVSSWVMYVESLFGIDNPSAWTNFGIAMTGLWIPAFINLRGIRNMAWFQNLTVILKFLPLAFVGIVGWFFVDSANFGGFNATGGSLMSAISAAAGVALFAFIGVECAGIAAGRVRDPRRNVGKASVYGTLAAGLLYVLVTAAVMGLVAHGKLINDGAPFVAAFATMFGGSTVLAKFVAAVAVVSGIGALNGWTLITAELPRAAANDGLFVKQFGSQSRRGVPAFGIVTSAIVASLLMAYSYGGGDTGLKVFNYLVYLSVVTVAIPYFFSALAQLSYLVSRRRRVHGAALTRDLGIASLSILFSLWVTASSGYQAVYQAVIVLLIGMPFYAFLKAKKEREGQVAEPIEYVEPPITAETVTVC